MNERIKTEYLCYLMNRAQIDAEGHYGYSDLCRILQETEFLPILEMDENRCGDCRVLRRDFSAFYMSYFEDEFEVSLSDILDEIYGENGTMMELLVVLAECFAYDLADSEFESGTGKWFREMLENCGLIMCCNGAFEEDYRTEEERVRTALDTVIFRKTGWDGEGGLFPLRWPKQDQRYVELITQMNNYIEENYDIC